MKPKPNPIVALDTAFIQPLNMNLWLFSEYFIEAETSGWVILPLLFMITRLEYLNNKPISSLYNSWEKGITRSAGSSTLGETSWASLATELIRCLRIRGGTSYIPIWGILSDIQTSVGTVHKNLRCSRSRGGDTAHSNWGYLVGTPHKIQPFQT